MSVAWAERDLYEQFEPKKDSLYFRVGVQGLISFHGRNCRIRKPISDEQRQSLFDDSAFIRISSDCYVNLNRISAIEDDYLCFRDGDDRIPVSRRAQQMIRKRLEEQTLVN